MSRSTMSRLTMLAIGIMLLLPASQASAQSDADLRRENQRLAARVAELEKELEAALQRIRDLEAQNAALRGSATGGRQPSDPVEPEKVSIDEAKPDASPRALLAALKKNYEESFKSQSMGEAPGSRERSMYLRSVEQWHARMAREMRQTVEWHVRIVTQVASGDKGYTLELQAIDPRHGTHLGDPFLATLPKNRARPIEQGGTARVYVVRGVVTPRLRLNPDRTSVGPVDNPKFVGPFSELNLREVLLEINGATPAETPADAGGAGG